VGEKNGCLIFVFTFFPSEDGYLLYRSVCLLCLHCYLAIPAEDRPIDKVLLTFVVIVMVWYRLTSSVRRRVERKEGGREGGREGMGVAKEAGPGKTA